MQIKKKIKKFKRTKITFLCNEKKLKKLKTENK